MASYQALYRKFRPQTFDGVICQEHIVKTLKNQMRSGRVSHAYLFCGTRGTGKTSTAKIFARAINCLEPSDGEPCNKCALCKATLEGRSVNVIEIDAASNNGVENIREIREEVKYPPTEGKYKVYIIDEVHMLSAGAFNALLKTLEEPPNYVIFILATTDPQKVPATILSRCQRFDFKRITAKDIASTLRGYASQEEIKITDAALGCIARLADGSMRDSLSILDQCISFYYKEEITIDKVLEIAGSVDDSVFFSMTDNIIEKSIEGLIDTVDFVVMQGRDISQFVTEYIVHLRNLLVAASVSDLENVIDVSTENAVRLKEQSRKMSQSELMYFIKTFSALASDMKYAVNQRILLEVALIKLCIPITENSYDAVAAKLGSLERDLKSGKYGLASENKGFAKQEKAKPKKKVVPVAQSKDVLEAMDIWNETKSDFDKITQELLRNVEMKQLEGDKLYLVCPNDAISRIINDRISVIIQKLEEKVGKTFAMEAVAEDVYEERYLTLNGDIYASESDESFNSLMDMIPDLELDD